MSSSVELQQWKPYTYKVNDWSRVTIVKKINETTSIFEDVINKESPSDIGSKNGAFQIW